MADPELDRSGSAAATTGYHGSPVPPSSRPSVASRTSRSSLRREQEPHDIPQHSRPASVAQSHSQSPQPVAAPVERALPPSPPSLLRQVQPSFSPLFTLLTSTSHSSNRQKIHYPTVHYVFADDDPEILTAALAQHHHGAHDDHGEEDDWSGRSDRAVILDMEPTDVGSGFEVVSASSLTPDWAVTSARVSRMEGGDGGATAGPNGSLVLKIEGVSIEPSPGHLGKTPTPEAELQSPGGSAGRQQPLPAAGDYADLLQDFDKRMTVLRKVVEAGAARQRALGDRRDQASENTVTEKATVAVQSQVAGDDTQYQGGTKQ
ncbi:hypothetical protein VTK56DRAFT_460 [Thermocarpiscus australiensis]